jgi:hypothetical protein
VRLLRFLAGPRAILLVLEDVHWADAETLAVLEYVADHVATEPVVCVLTCRTDEGSAGTEAIQALIDRRAADAIRLARLDQADVLAALRLGPTRRTWCRVAVLPGIRQSIYIDELPSSGPSLVRSGTSCPPGSLPTRASTV